MKIAQRLTAALVLVVTLTLCIRAFVDMRRAIARNEEGVHRTQQQLGEVLDVAIRQIWRSDGWEQALVFLREVEKKQGDLRVRWVWLEKNENNDYKPLIPVSTIRSRVQGESTIAFEREDLSGYIVTYRPVRLPELPLGAVELTRPTADDDEQIKTEAIRQITAGLLAILVYMVVASVLGRRWIGQPIDALVIHARRVAEGDFSSISQAMRRDDLGRLAGEMNTMSRRLMEAQDRANQERTLRIEVQEQLTHADRLASVGRITAALIHDLGTPLNVISGRATMIAEGDVTGEKAQSGARRIAEQAHRIGEMIRELLRFARRGEMEREPTVVANLAREVAKIVQPLSQKARVKIDIEDEDASPSANVNRTQIRQVLMNLVMNGVQAMPKGGNIQIRVRDDGDYIAMEVHDDGPGIPPEVIDLIFEPFFTTKAEGEGTGLGLSVCQSILHAHGGAINAESRPGEGTTFLLRIPKQGGSDESHSDR
ncbi:MAG: ATP-binding protein [Deltaproteobacteria bacterium]